MDIPRDQPDGEFFFTSAHPEEYKQHLDSMAHTPGQRLAAEAIYAWIQAYSAAEEERSIKEPWSNSTDTEAAWSRVAAIPAYTPDLTQLSGEQRQSAREIIARFREYPGLLLDRYDFSDIRFADATLNHHKGHFISIMKALMADTESHGLGVVKVLTNSNSRTFYWLREDMAAEQPTKMLVVEKRKAAKGDQARDSVWHEQERQKCAVWIARRMRAHPELLFGYSDFHDLPYDGETLASQYRPFKKIMRALVAEPLHDNMGLIRQTDGNRGFYWFTVDADGTQPTRTFRAVEAERSEPTWCEKSWLRSELAQYITGIMQAHPGRWFSLTEFYSFWSAGFEEVSRKYRREALAQAILVTVRHPEYGASIDIERGSDNKIRIRHDPALPDSSQVAGWTDKIARMRAQPKG